MGRFVDLTGKKFSSLRVISRSNNMGKKTMWRCICDCGKESTVAGSNLVNGHTKSCGCLFENNFSTFLENATKHATAANRRFLDVEPGTMVTQISIKHANGNSLTGIRGVCVVRGKYRATLTFKGETHYLGCFIDIGDAIKARKEAEEKYFKPVIDKAKKEGVI